MRSATQPTDHDKPVAKILARAAQPTDKTAMVQRINRLEPMMESLTDTQPSHIRQYRPAFIDGVDPTVVQFATIDGLMAIPFVSQFRMEPDFYQFSLSGGRDGMRDGGTVSLIAEYDSGRRWFVVGYIEGEPLDLPTWKPVR